ncbi:hypothetical protein BM221_003710 [Beauveria bassiana]|uniref:Uncharacterized protein n=1 Tax=Beauveria bassiana TaxID=176275 RepID=A0A2N6NVE6_BEABA|nr:hypothetical protein BM221_003710 [Beauveria bassiana]
MAGREGATTLLRYYDRKRHPEALRLAEKSEKTPNFLPDNVKAAEPRQPASLPGGAFRVVLPERSRKTVIETVQAAIWENAGEFSM